MEKKDVQSFVLFLRNTATTKIFADFFDKEIVPKLKNAAENGDYEFSVEIPENLIEEQNIIEIYLNNLFRDTNMSYSWDLKEEKYVFINFYWGY